jgi:hypothetical protein
MNFDCSIFYSCQKLAGNNNIFCTFLKKSFPWRLYDVQNRLKYVPGHGNRKSEFLFCWIVLHLLFKKTYPKPTFGWIQTVKIRRFFSRLNIAWFLRKVALACFQFAICRFDLCGLFLSTKYNISWFHLDYRKFYIHKIRFFCSTNSAHIIRGFGTLGTF